MSAAATPRSTSCLSQAVSSPRTSSSLKRLQTMAMRRPLPSRFGVTTFMRFAPRGAEGAVAKPSILPFQRAAPSPRRLDRLDGHRIVGRNILDDFEPEARHAGNPLGPREHAHLAHAQVAKD